MDVSQVVARLQLRLADLELREIEQAPGLDEAMRNNKASPAVYVLPLSERGSYLPHTGAVDQLEHRLFGVLMVLDVGRRAGQVDLATVRRRVKLALVGWCPRKTSASPSPFRAGNWWTSRGTAPNGGPMNF